MHCTIRTAGPDDAAAIARIKSAASATLAAQGSPAIDAAPYAAVIAASPGLLLVADSGGFAAGFVALRRETHAAVAAARPIQLWQLYVSPAFHGAGVAAQLMDAALERAREDGHDAIWLGVSEDNARAIAFYRKSGFDSAGVHGVGAGDHAHHDLVMTRALG